MLAHSCLWFTFEMMQYTNVQLNQSSGEIFFFLSYTSDQVYSQPRWLSGLMRSRVHSLWLLVDHCVLRNWDRILVRAVKGLNSRAGMVSICPLLWQRDVKLQQTTTTDQVYKEVAPQDWFNCTCSFIQECVFCIYSLEYAWYYRMINNEHHQQLHVSSYLYGYIYQFVWYQLGLNYNLNMTCFKGVLNFCERPIETSYVWRKVCIFSMAGYINQNCYLQH